MRGGRWVWLAVAFALVGSPAAYAQEGLRDRDPDIEEARNIAQDLSRANFHHGPFYLLSAFQLSDVGYNQQFFVPTADHSNGFSLSISAPHKMYFVPSKKTVFSADFDPSYAFVSSKLGKNQFGYRVRGDARVLLNHIYADVYAESANELRANIGDINRLITVRNVSYGVEGEVKYSSRTSGKFSVGLRTYAFPKDRLQPANVPLEVLQRTQHDYRAGFVHKTFPLTTLSLNGEHSDYQFDVAKGSNSQRNYVGAGLSYDEGRHQIRLEAGPTQLKFDKPTVRNYRGLSGRLTTSHRIGVNWSGGASLSRDVDFSVYKNNPYYITDRLATSLTTAATRRLQLRVLGDLGRDIYKVPVNGILRRDKLAYGAVGWLYTLRHINGGFDVGYFSRTSTTPDGLPQHGIRVTVRLSVNP